MHTRHEPDTRIAWVHTHLPRLRAGELDCLSVKFPGQPITYRSWISLRDAEFRVFQPGRLRCVASGVRNVHAWVVGEPVLTLTHWNKTGDRVPAGYRRAVYDPFKGPSFVDAESLEPVLTAEWAILSGKHLFYAGL